MSDSRRTARDLADEFIAKGRVTGWFEPLYSAADGDTGKVPWADMIPNPGLVEWIARGGAPRALPRGGRALVVGSGLGDDAEEIARLGLEVTAFDISPTAIAWTKRRFPSSPVAYRVADLFVPPVEWKKSFALVFEAYTIQSFPTGSRQVAAVGVAEFVAPGGTLLLIARGRDEKEMVAGPPWALAPSELEALERAGLEPVSFEDYMDRETPPKRRFRAEYVRPRSSAS